MYIFYADLCILCGSARGRAFKPIACWQCRVTYIITHEIQLETSKDSKKTFSRWIRLFALFCLQRELDADRLVDRHSTGARRVTIILAIKPQAQFVTRLCAASLVYYCELPSSHRLIAWKKHSIRALRCRMMIDDLHLVTERMPSVCFVTSTEICAPLCHRLHKHVVRRLHPLIRVDCSV